MHIDKYVEILGKQLEACICCPEKRLLLET